MKNFSWKKVLPHLIAIGVFLIVALIYCRPALEGKVLQQSDIVHWKGMAQSTFEYKEKHGHFPLWNTNLFAGMPNYQVSIDGKGFVPDLNGVFTLWLPKPVSYFFLACVCFYILGMSLGVNYLVAILGSLAYAYCSYDPVIISVGHESKMMAIAYMPALLAGLLLLYEKRYALGLIVTSLFAFMEIAANHPQINYYFLIAAGIMTLFYVVKWIRAGEWKHMLVALSLALLGGFTGVANCAITLLTTSDYAKYTMRNGKTLENTGTGIKQVKTTGLDKDYAFSWSIAKSEILTFFMPGAYGGSSSETFDENSKLVSTLAEKGVPESSAVQLAGSLPKYWGGLESTSGPVYFGVVLSLLAVIGLVVLRSPHRWWLLATLVFTIFMAWGKYFEGFNTLLFHYLPLYNKFRAPSMALVIPQLVMPILAILAIQQLLFNSTPEQVKASFKKILYALGGVIGAALLVYLFIDFSSAIDEQIIKAYTNPQNGSAEMGHVVVNGMIADRKGMFTSGLVRTIMFAGLVAGILFLYIRGMIKPVVAVVIFLLVNTIDLLVLDSKYLNSENFMDPESYQSENFHPSPANQQILQDTSSHYRVFNVAPDRFSESMTSYFHRSIGGYHPAKLRIYQDLIENQLSKGVPNMQVLNMLDTRYFIVPTQNNQQAVQRNEAALGACWLVPEVKFVNGPVEEINALDSFNAVTTAIVDNSYKGLVASQPVADSTASIQLKEYSNDYISYNFKSGSNQFAVFSEVYYPSGWNAYIDGKKVEYCKTNYVLRGLPVPAGPHTIEFKFEPSSYYTGQKLSYIGNFLLYASLLGGILMLLKQQKARS